jgi:PAS domain-containing protein
VPQKDVELILLRQWASYLTMPVFIAGADGNLLFYNEPAETILGRSYEFAGEMPLEDLATIFETTDEDGTPLSTDALPLGIALFKHRPSHRRFRIRGLDGVWRLVDATAFPIEAQAGRCLGAVAFFWEPEAA